jgi:hypothetical protein
MRLRRVYLWLWFYTDFLDSTLGTAEPNSGLL